MERSGTQPTIWKPVRWVGSPDPPYELQPFWPCGGSLKFIGSCPSYQPKKLTGRSQKERSFAEIYPRKEPCIIAGDGWPASCRRCSLAFAQQDAAERLSMLCLRLIFMEGEAEGFYRCSLEVCLHASYPMREEDNWSRTSCEIRLSWRPDSYPGIAVLDLGRDAVAASVRRRLSEKRRSPDRVAAVMLSGRT